MCQRTITPAPWGERWVARATHLRRDAGWWWDRVGNDRRCGWSQKSMRSLLTSPSSSNLKDGKEENNNGMVKEETTPPVTSAPPPPPSSGSILEASLTGVGQVIFLQSPRSGGIILGSLMMGDAFLAGCAGWGALSATLTARGMGFQPSTKTQAGLYSYNGTLVGCATAVFLVPLSISPTTTDIGASLLHSMLAATTVTTMGSIAATCLTASLGRAYFTQQPQWTYAFNLVTLSMILQSHRYKLVNATGSTTSTLLENDSTTTTAMAVTELSENVTPNLMELCLEVPFHGISQIFVVEEVMTGIGILTATALYSPKLAGHALMGSIVGSATGYLLVGAEWNQIVAGLWGYNGALCSMAVAVFTVDTPASRVVSMGAAVVSTLLLGALSPLLTTLTASGGEVTIPLLTLPFCWTMTAVYPLFQGVSTSLQLASVPHSPEKNSP